MSTSHPLRDSSLTAESRSLRVEVEITPSETCSCPLKETAESGLTLHEVRKNSSGGSCESDLVVSDDEGERRVINTVTPVEEDCFCPVFGDFDVLPRIEDVGNESILVSTYVSDRCDMKEVLEELREKAEQVTVVRISSVDEDEETELFLSEMTPKQRETIRQAVVGGYYDSPQEMTLKDLADEFGVTKSAVSQRLKRAESKIVVETVGDSADEADA